MIKANIGFFLFLATILFFLPANVLAQTNSDGALMMTKKIQNPKNGEFVTTLSANDATFEPNRQVNFRIEIKNVSSVDLSNIQMGDQFPQNPDLLDFVSGPANSNFDVNTRTLTWMIGNLKKEETQSFDIQAKVKPAADLPDQNIVCTQNFIQAQKDQHAVLSNAAFCLQPQVLQTLGAGKLPKTGLEVSIGFLSGAFLFLGFWLRKFTLKDQQKITNRIFEIRNLIRRGGEKNE